jgi:hypothetical protein
MYATNKPLLEAMGYKIEMYDSAKAGSYTEADLKRFAEADMIYTDRASRGHLENGYNRNRLENNIDARMHDIIFGSKTSKRLHVLDEIHEYTESQSYITSGNEVGLTAREKTNIKAINEAWESMRKAGLVREVEDGVWEGKKSDGTWESVFKEYENKGVDLRDDVRAMLADRMEEALAKIEKRAARENMFEKWKSERGNVEIDNQIAAKNGLLEVLSSKNAKRGYEVNKETGDVSYYGSEGKQKYQDPYVQGLHRVRHGDGFVREGEYNYDSLDKVTVSAKSTKGAVQLSVQQEQERLLQIV